MAAFVPERHGLLDIIKGMIDTDDRSAKIIQEVVTYPEDFWGYIKEMDKKNPEDKCKDLIYSGDEYKDKSWIQRRRAKIICDFLMFWSRKPDTMLNEIINKETGDLIPHAYDDIKAKIEKRVEKLKGYYDSLKDAAAETIEDTTNKIKSMTTEIGVLITLGTTYVSDTCVAGADTAGDVASATIYTMDKMLADLMKININIDVFKVARVGEGFIDSIVGNHKDTVILMLEGLMTVCAGTMAVKHYNVVFNSFLRVLRYLETGLRVGAAGSVLYVIGSVTHLLSEKLKHITGEKAEELKAISGNLAGISTRIRATTGDVDENTIRRFRDELQNVLEPAVEEANQTARREEDRITREAAAEAEDPREGPAQTAANTRLEEERAAAAEAGDPPAAGDGSQAGGKKHKKSQKKPRKKASKSKRSKKAGKKTRKSRKKTRGKKH